jgi:hypothetical protein
VRWASAGRARPARWAHALLLWAFGGAALAQSAWTVQTVAFRDLRDANAQVAYLATVGLPAYAEFTMANGLQYVRVRVGCHDRRDAAEAWADLLRGAVTPEAVAVPVEAAPPAHVPCVATDVGFLKPSVWSLVSADGDLPTFQVEVGGHTAYLRHDGEAWRLWQSLAPDPAPAPAAPAGQEVRVDRVAGRPVAWSDAVGPLCPGTLVATAGPVAIVDRGDAVVACRVLPAVP